MRILVNNKIQIVSQGDSNSYEYLIERSYATS